MSSDAETPKVGKPKKSAVGIPGIAASMQYALAEMGASRTVRTLRRMNHVDGFDCPSCAWPDPDRRKAAEFCENGAKAVAWEATRKRVGRGLLRRALDRRTARAARPLARAQRPAHRADVPRAGRHALRADQLGRRVRARRRSAARDARPEPRRVLHERPGAATRPRSSTSCSPAGSARTTCPTARTCATSRAAPRSTQTIGIGKGTVTLEDIAEHADLIVIVGQNPGTNHPRMLTALEDAKKRGARIVAINPLPEAGLVRFQQPADAARAGRPGHQARRPVPAGAGQRRPRAVRRREQGAARARGRAPATSSTATSSTQYCDGFDDAVAALAGAGLDGRSSGRAG